MPLKGRTEYLRRGRQSFPGSNYFVTAVTKDRRKTLATGTIYQSLLESIEKLRVNDSTISLIWILMEDHIHGIFRLGNSMGISNVMTSIKGPMTPHMRKVNLLWQKNFYDHRIRPTESLASFLRYVLCNPYRKNLLSINQDWPFIYTNHEEIDWFMWSTNNGRPHANWLNQENPYIDTASRGKPAPYRHPIP